MSNNANAHWITWENHRRSRELADAFDAEYACFEREAPTLIRYLLLSARTAVFILRRRSRLVFCQNPSIALTGLLCMLRKVMGYTLVVDRHSNFMLETLSSPAITWRLYHALSRWTVRNADLTIVTNEGLAEVVHDWGGHAYVLQDRIPRLQPSRPRRRPGCLGNPPGRTIMCITSYADDEPIGELVEAFAISIDVTAYFTGDYRGTPWAYRVEELRSQGIVLTGFISEQDYVDLMDNVDAVMVLTTGENVLTCGAYEALSLGKPLILSDTEALRWYFGKTIVYVAPNATSIRQGVNEVLERRDELKSKVSGTAENLRADWYRRFDRLRRQLPHKDELQA